jgi:predicted NBD/HSP70 family sugar kinase
VARVGGNAGRGSATSSGALLQLIIDGRATTRTELASITGLARSTVSQRLDPLVEQGLVRETGEGPSTGGRPPMVVAFNRDAGVVLAADLGATHARLGVADLGGEPLAEHSQELNIGEGPERVLTIVQERFGALLAESGKTSSDVRGIGMGLPGPVEFASGTPVSPPIMPGWNEYPVRAFFREHYDAPVFVDNDVNIMALGEYSQVWRNTVRDLLYVKVGTGIGCGIICGGVLHRGAEGAAGDIGHIRLSGADDALCRCSNVGCVEAVAGGGALARRLSELGYEARTPSDVVDLVLAGNPEAVRLVRTAGRQIGEILAGTVNLLNPAVIVIGGRIAAAQEQLLAGVREIVYQRSLPLATRHLQIVRSELGSRAGIMGAAVLVLDELLSPEAIDNSLGRAALPA